MEVIAGRVIELLESATFKELSIICNFQDDLESMKDMASAIKAVLSDAEKRATKNNQINRWLQKLKDLLLDTEDLLDAYSADELAREVMTKDKRAKEVRIFFSKNNRIVCAAKMGRQIKAIRKKLDGISYEKNNLYLREISPNASIESDDGRQTHSHVRDEDVVGRDKERMQLVDILLNPLDVNSNVPVVAIVGIGGLGKTTLAQQVYNDEAVKSHFELKKWVCVSDESGEFNIKKIAQNIIDDKETNNQLDEVIQGLIKKIEGKRFLLVLDDVWNEHREKWIELEKLLRGGKKGSMIIVTTRSEEVAQAMDTRVLLKLNYLDLEKSWELFRRAAFRDGKEPDNQELVGIGKDIVKKCAGVPLAIRTIGSLLFTKQWGVSEWSYFRNNELANIDSKVNEIFSILKLSYDHLPSHLKNCFAFCSLFPKNYEIERETLIRLWIAEGFIPLDKKRCSKDVGNKSEEKCLEDVGDQYFKQLLSRCLFQDVKQDNSNIWSCKMHDLIHDLAQSITKNECYIVASEKTKEKFGDGICHLSSHFDGAGEFSFGDANTKKMRTILFLQGHFEFILSQSSSRVYNLICGPTTSFPKHLRVLVLVEQKLKIPESIGDLKHLRYLDLTMNTELKKLPRGITKLHNLQTLILNYCESLIELPSDLRRLVSLRHLEFDGCCNVLRMPCGLGCLTNLQTLTRFIVDEVSGGGARMTELRDLICLRGNLEITNLRRQRRKVNEVESSKFLLHMSELGGLDLCWGASSSLPREEYEHDDDDEKILKALEPPHTIKLLNILDFSGKWLSEWIGSLTSLQSLQLIRCTSLASLPESIGKLTSLQSLHLQSCTSLASLPESIGNLTSLQSLHLQSCTSLASLPESIGSLTSLQFLYLSHCTSLASLPESIKNLTSLQSLSFSYHAFLTSLPESIGNLTSLQSLSFSYHAFLTSLSKSIGNLTSLQSLNLSFCASLASLPKSIGNLTSLQFLDLSYCASLASLPKSIGSLTSLQSLNLHRCTSLASLPKSIGSLTSLQSLNLHRCTSLASLPKSIGSLTSLQSLHLHQCTSLASLSESIGSLASLQSLYLCECTSLASLPESVGNLISLQYLDLRECTSLASLPKSIGNLTSLQYLDLYQCTSLASLPESIGNLTSLYSLDVHQCTSLASLPESIGNLTSLHYLNVHQCTSLASLPESVGNLTSLQSLYLCECTSLASLPESVGNLTSLQSLYLRECTSLASLPESVGNLTSLQYLDLHECTSLASLPESVGNLTSLYFLDVHQCTSLASLPESVGNLTSLHSLDVHQCTSLASLPESVGNLTSLQSLYLNECTSLASLPESIGNLTSLRFLHLFNCTSLASLPESIGNITSLQYLDVHECTSLASLPDSIKSLTSL